MKHKLIFLIACLGYALSGMAGVMELDVTRHGAVGDGKTLNTGSLQGAIDGLHARGGGVLRFPAGRYLTGSLRLKSGVTLYLEEGAVLLGSTSPYDYPKFSTEKELKVNNDHFDQALIYADGAENIGITGGGCVDGQGRELALTIDSLHHTGELVDPHYNTYRKRPNTRPKLLFVRGCRNVRIHRVSFRSSAAWGLSFSLCTDVTLDSLHIENRAYWNNDGIDISDCKDVRIAHCDVNSADDGICLKSHNRDAYNDRVSIAHCRIISSASAIKFGTESGGGFKNVTLENIEIVYPGRASKGMAYISLSRLADVPENVDGYPEFSMFGELPAWGFYVRHVSGLTLKGITLRLREDDYRPAFVFDRVSRLNLSDIVLPEDKQAGQVVLRQTGLQRKARVPERWIFSIDN